MTNHLVAQGRDSARIQRLKLSSSDFTDQGQHLAFDMNDEERAIMGRHAEYWRPFIDSGQMVIFGPVLDGTGSWGLGVVETDNEEELRTFAAGDPVVTSGIGTVEIGKLLAGFVRQT